MQTKRAFLKSKGLNDVEISRACQLAGVPSSEFQGIESTGVLHTKPAELSLTRPNPQTSWLVALRDYANVILILGGSAYALHYLWKVRFY